MKTYERYQRESRVQSNIHSIEAMVLHLNESGEHFDVAVYCYEVGDSCPESNIEILRDNGLDDSFDDCFILDLFEKISESLCVEVGA